jgi:hypothetical protein
MTDEQPRGLMKPLDESFWHVMREMAVTKAELIDRLAAAPPEQRPAIRRALKQVRTIKHKHIAYYHRLFPIYWTGDMEPWEPEK